MHSRTREIYELTRVRVLLFWREPEVIFWVLVFPLILAIALGLAFREKGVQEENVGVIPGEGAEGLVEMLAESPNLDPRLADSETQGDEWLRTGKVAVLIAPGDPLTLRFDPVRPEGDMTRVRVEDVLQRAFGRQDPVKIVRQEVQETGSRYIDWLIPGLLGMNLMGTGIWGIGFALVDARQKKLLKRFLVTPMRRSSFLLSFILSRLVFLIAEIVVLLGFAFVVLGVPLRGSLVGLGALCLLGAMTFAGVGILLASRARTVEGISGLMNLVMMPMWIGSGVFFSYHRFPEAVHPILKALPLTALNDGLRGLILEGDGLLTLWPEISIQVAWALGTFLFALRVFRWK